MMTAPSTRLPALTLACALALSTTTGAQPPAGSQATNPAITQTMILNEAQLQGFFAAMDDFQALSDKSAAWSKADPSKPAAFARALQASAETQAILRKHGFSDDIEFQRVAYNAAMAYGVLEQGGKEAVKKKLEGAEAQQAQAMKQMAQHLSPEQLKAMQGQMNAGMATAKALYDVPDANLELMKPYRGRMAKLGKK